MWKKNKSPREDVVVCLERKAPSGWTFFEPSFMYCSLGKKPTVKSFSHDNLNLILLLWSWGDDHYTCVCLFVYVYFLLLVCVVVCVLLFTCVCMHFVGCCMCVRRYVCIFLSLYVWFLVCIYSMPIVLHTVCEKEGESRVYVCVHISSTCLCVSSLRVFLC